MHAQSKANADLHNMWRMAFPRPTQKPRSDVKRWQSGSHLSVKIFRRPPGQSPVCVCVCVRVRRHSLLSYLHVPVTMRYTRRSTTTVARFDSRRQSYDIDVLVHPVYDYIYYE